MAQFKVLLSSNHPEAQAFKKSNFERLSRSIFALFPGEWESLELHLTDSFEIQKLNQQFRGKNKPTDVLSFNLDEQMKRASIVIDLDTAAIQAKDFGHSLQREVNELFIHACLHLVGFDHESSTDSRMMEDYENFFAAQLLRNRAS